MPSSRARRIALQGAPGYASGAVSWRAQDLPSNDVLILVELSSVDVAVSYFQRVINCIFKLGLVATPGPKARDRHI